MNNPKNINGNNQYKNKKPYVKRPTSAFAANEQMNEESESDECQVEGRNAVFEVLRGTREIDKLLVSGEGGSMGQIIALAREKGVVVQQCDRRKLDRLSATGAHQGVIALCAAAEYAEIDDILALAKSRNEQPLIILCDGITDPHNLGAIIRTAEVAGAHGVIIPRRRSAGLNSACAKAAAGALEHLPVAKCANVQTAVLELKKKGIFVFAADMDGTKMYDTDFKIPALIVIGSEGEGISRTTRDQCDFVVSIPQKGKINSLNASNAAAVLIFEALRQRGL